MLRYFLCLFCSLFIPPLKKTQNHKHADKGLTWTLLLWQPLYGGLLQKTKEWFVVKTVYCNLFDSISSWYKIVSQIMWRWRRPRWLLTPCLRWIKVWNIVPRSIYVSMVLTSTPTGMLAFRSGRQGTERALLKQTQQRPDRCLFFLKFLSK